MSGKSEANLHNRACGGCTLCCKLIPVEELAKPAGMRCAHQRTGKGCARYATRPVSCREWSCMWLIGDEDGKPLSLRRPDRTHYVIDMAPDYVRVRNNETGEVVSEVTVLQVWVDPAHPDAWQDKDLLDMLERQNIPALIRYGSEKAFGIFPPGRTETGKWERSENHEVSRAPEFLRKRAEHNAELLADQIRKQNPT